MVKKLQSLVLIFGLVWVGVSVVTMPGSVMAGGGIKYAAPKAVGAGDCTSWADACTLQFALCTAISGNEIWVKAGVHYPGTLRNDTFTLVNGVAVLGGFAGNETNREERNWQVNPTILSGDIDQNDKNTDGNYIAESTDDLIGYNAYHVVTALIDAPNTTKLNGFVITAGKANGSVWPEMYGGGLFNNDSASPTLTNLVFIGNLAETGGGIFNYYLNNPILTNVTFVANKANSNGGGGIFNGEESDPTLTDVSFISNTTTYVGSGIYNSCGNSPSLTNVIFSGNQAQSGGGMASSQGSAATLTNVIFSFNTAVENGGGISNHMYSSPTLTNVTFNNNIAIKGGGMYNSDNSVPVLSNVIMWSDIATNQPEIYNIENSLANVNFSDIQGCGGSSDWNKDCGINGGNNIDADPLFIDGAHGNLRLKSISPAIDAGYNFPTLSTGVTTDLDGHLRYFDIASVPDTGIGAPPIVDMGAYEAQSINLTITIVGEGAASANPDQPSYNYTEQVTLTANADPGWSFNSWSEDATGADHPLTVSILDDTHITATFTHDAYSLTVEVTPEGSGSVRVDPQQTTYHYGDEVTLTASAEPGWAFTEWSGDEAGSVNPLTVTIQGNTNITAAFRRSGCKIFLPLVLH